MATLRALPAVLLAVYVIGVIYTGAATPTEAAALGLAGALVMYDRVLSMGRFAPRPVRAGGPVEALPPPEFGDPVWARKRRRRASGVRDD